jgi:hypothetical protein
MNDRSPRLRLVQAMKEPGPNHIARTLQSSARVSVKYGKSIPKAIQAEVRGIWRFIAWTHKYINAHNYNDMRDGKPANARAHHDIVKERRVIAGFWILVLLIALLWGKKNYGNEALIFAAFMSAVGFFYWGKDVRIVDPLSGMSIGLSETGIQAAVAVAVMNINLERFPDAWKQVKIVRGLRQDGETMRITLALPGAIPGSLARTRREKIASALELTTAQCIVDPDPLRRNSSEVEITIHPGEPWNKEAVPASLGINPRQTCIWDEIEFGEDVNGRPVKLSLLYKAMLLGGLPDMGKTTAALSILMHAMLDPWVRLWTMDAKGLDFPGMAPMCWKYVGNSQDDAIAALQELYRVGEAKMDRLRELGRTKLDRGLQEMEIQSEVITPLCFVDVLFVDEMRFFTAGDDPKKSQQIISLLSRIVEMFRACGIVLVSATQRPHSQVVDTSLRDLIRIRGALATTTWQASNTILGDTAYKMGFSATEFDAEDKGVMWLRELKSFTQTRAHWVDPTHFNNACRVAFEIRNTAGTLPGQIQEALIPVAPPFLAQLRDVIMAEGQGRLPTKEILLDPYFKGYTADSLGKAAREHHLQSAEVGPWGDTRKVRGYKLDDIALAVAECSKDPKFKPGIRGIVR